jgi:sugar lactone lactonase YvrE
MAINFPPSANTGYIHTEGNFSYQFTGAKWKPVNRVDYTVQASNTAVSSNTVIIDMSKDGIQSVTLSNQAVVSFTNTPGLNEYEKVLINFNINPAYLDTITTPAWEANTATFEIGKIVSVNARDTSPYAVFFKPDGLKMYITGETTDTVYQYALNTAWEANTAIFETGKSKSVAAQDAIPGGIFFKPDGSKMYILGDLTNTVYQYGLNPVWDVSNATFEIGRSKNVTEQEGNPRGIFFKPDGSKMYIAGLGNRTVYQYALTTPWEANTAIFETGKTKSLVDQGGGEGLFFDPDGLRMYTIAGVNDTVYQYTLTTPWEANTAIFETGKSKSVAAQDTSPASVFFKPDGSKMYIMGNLSKTVYQYNITVTTQDTIANVTWPSTIEWESGYAPSLPTPQQTALIEIEARTDYIGTNYVGRLVGRNF